MRAEWGVEGVDLAGMLREAEAGVDLRAPASPEADPALLERRIPCALQGLLSTATGIPTPCRERRRGSDYVHTIPKGALIMGSAPVSVSAPNGYEEGND